MTAQPLPFKEHSCLSWIYRKPDSCPDRWCMCDTARLTLRAALSGKEVVDFGTTIGHDVDPQTGGEFPNCE